MARVMLLAGVEDRFCPREAPPQALFAHEGQDGAVAPRGFEALESFRLDGTLPLFRWRAAGRLIERRIWMEPGQDRTFVSYRILRGGPGLLSLRPLFANRPLDGQRTAPAPAEVEECEGGWRVTIEGIEAGVWVTPAGSLVREVAWVGPFLRRAERERGLDDRELLFTPGTIEAPLRPGAPVVLVAFRRPEPEPSTPAAALRAARRVDLAALAAVDGAASRRPLVRQLAFAASQLRVERRSEGKPEAKRTILAGYHWFADWGRDTMIALHGLALAAGRPDEARAMLSTFIGALDRGMLPNAFHDPGEPVEYNTIDATLWLFQALGHYLEATGDWPFLEGHLEALEEVIQWHVEGTRYGIRVDPADGLLRGGVPGVALTWMDAKDGEWVVTPRQGKPVEVAALWYNALYLLGRWRERAGRSPLPFRDMARRALASARERYWYAAGGYLYDVVDGPEGDDPSLRPNQLMALGLAAPLIEGERARSALEVVTARLLTPFGLRTLTPDDPRYRSRFGGDHRQRDGAYQMGIVWPWLLGPYLDAHRRVYGDPSAPVRVLAAFEGHLRQAGLGTVSEIFEAEPPYRPVGAIAQAWSVGELLRHALTGEPPDAR